MNLKDMKKVHEDDKMATFRNKNGHEVRVAKKGLSPERLKALKALPLHASEGADVVKDPTEGLYDPANASAADTGLPVTAAPPPNKTEGDNDLHFGDSIPGSPVDVFGTFIKKGGLTSGITNPGKIWEEAKQEHLAKANQPTVNSPMPGDDSAPAPDASGDEQPLAQPSPPPQKQKPTMLAQNKSQPQNDGAPIGAGQAQTTNQVYQDTYNKTYNESAQRRAQDDVAWGQDLKNGHITPKTYADLFNDSGILGKVGTLFGLMVSGAGSGLAHQSNAVIDMMNKELDRDLQAQDKNKANAVNYMRLANEHELNQANIKHTNALTGGQLEENKFLNGKNKAMMAIVQHLENTTNSVSNNPQAKANATQALGTIKNAVGQELVQNNDKMAQNEAAFKAKNEALREAAMFIPGAESKANSNESHHVAGYGDANQDVPQSLKDELNGKREYDRAAKAYIDFAKKYGGLNPKQLDPRIVSQGESLAANVQNQSRAKNNGGVWKAGEQNFIETTVPSKPAKWDAYLNAIPKVEQTIRDNEAEAITKARSLGMTDFKGFGGQQKQQDIQPYNGKNYIVDHVNKKVLGIQK